MLLSCCFLSIFLTTYKKNYVIVETYVRPVMDLMLQAHSQPLAI
jgi:hypothetical protein